LIGPKIEQFGEVQILAVRRVVATYVILHRTVILWLLRCESPERAISEAQPRATGGARAVLRPREQSGGPQG
jgi:hypothetical protein